MLLCINGYAGIDWMRNTEKSKTGIRQVKECI